MMTILFKFIFYFLLLCNISIASNVSNIRIIGSFSVIEESYSVIRKGITIPLIFTLTDEKGFSIKIGNEKDEIFIQSITNSLPISIKAGKYNYFHQATIFVNTPGNFIIQIKSGRIVKYFPITVKIKRDIQNRYPTLIRNSLFYMHK